MHVLLLGDRSAERVRAARLLTDAGMSVDVCVHGSGVCSGMEDECPIDAGSVDVAVAVAPRGHRLDPQGIACTHRARIPTVTVGATSSDPVLQLASSSLARVDERVVDAVRAAVADATAHQRAVEEAFAGHPELGVDLEVGAERRVGAIRVVLTGDVPQDRVAGIAEIARAAVREYDRHVKVIDVVVSAEPDRPADHAGS